MKKVYLDNASITPIDDKVKKVLAIYNSEKYGNPSSIHSFGVEAKRAVERARKQIGVFFHAHPDEFIFTGSGTEANNLAILGLFKNLVLKEKKKPQELHMITSAIEHPSVLECARHLEEIGVAVDYVGVDEAGIVKLKEIKEKLKPETFLVSIMHVNNEIGSIQPILEIAKIIRHHNKPNLKNHQLRNLRTILHSDASQSPLFLELNTLSLGVDLLTIDGQKIYGPRGIGLLWKRRGISLSPIIYGGGQENGLRSGTENVSAIMGLAKALEISESRRDEDSKRISALRDYFIFELKRRFPKIIFNGSLKERIPNNVNISIPKLDNEFFLLELDARGIVCSTKSSCLRDEVESYVIKALGKDETTARSSIRFSLGRETSKKDIEYVLKCLFQTLKQ